MALTQDEREKYNNIIQALYGGAVSSSPDQITDDVADVVNTILNSATECSKAVTITATLIELLFPPSGIIDFTVAVIKTGYNAISDWIDQCQNNQIATACLDSAKLNWRSPLQMALLGI
ncbi:MAG: hypothetical protein PHT38_00840 [Halothiobacillus sp.]|nr:hypothetical protein [Halothiobacillus sp.]